MNYRLVFFFVLFIACMIAIFVVTISVVQNPRQLTRRIFQQFTPCKFGTGTKFQIEKKLNLRNTSENPVNLIFSISLFGQYSETFHTDYIVPLFALIEKVKTKLPQAQVRIYFAQNLPESLQNDLLQAQAEIYTVSPEPKGFEGTLWRFFPADDNLPFISIDADDDLFNDGYVAQVKKWLAGDKKFFLVRHRWSALLPMTAGRWGAKPGALGDMKIQELSETYCDSSFGIDEGFLNRELWPLVKTSVESSSLDPEELGLIVLIIVVLALFIALCYYVLTACFCARTPTIPTTGKKKSMHSYAAMNSYGVTYSTL